MTPVYLFLDDDPLRTKRFLSKVPSAHTAETVPGIIKLIEKYDHIHTLFLDHDLGGETFVSSRRDDCGMEVARFLHRNKKNIDLIVVHSMNNPAAEQMAGMLRDAKYDVEVIPFHLLLPRIV